MPELRKISRRIVAALIISSDGKILMGQKDPQGGGVYADCWHIPGGGIDEGESEGDALAREVMEEVGIDISDAEVSLFDDRGRGEAEKTLPSGERVLCEMSFAVYRIDLSQDADEVEVTLSDDLVKCRWTDRGELGSIAMTPPSVELFRRVGWMR